MQHLWWRSECLCLKSLPQTARCTMLRSGGDAVTHTSQSVSKQFLKFASGHRSYLVQLYLRSCIGTCIRTSVESVGSWAYLSAFIFPHICCSNSCHSLPQRARLSSQACGAEQETPFHPCEDCCAASPPSRWPSGHHHHQAVDAWQDTSKGCSRDSWGLLRNMA